MVKVYEPLEYYDRKEKYSIFLAGGIDRAPDWQKDAIKYIKEKYGELDLAILNPRRSVPFSREEYEAHSEQVKWEFMHLRYANAVLFWFPENAPCTTSLFELGYWLSTSKVSLGIQPGHYKERSISTQVNLLNKSRIGLTVKVASTLEETIDNAVDFINQGKLSGNKKA